MYTPQQMPPSPQGRDAGAVSGTLATGVAAIVVAALCGLGALVVTLAGGKEMLRGVLDELLRTRYGLSGDSTRLRDTVVDLAIEQAYGTMVARAYLFGGVAVVFLLLGVAVWARRNWARIVFTVVAPLAALLWLRDLTDVNVTALHLLDVVALTAVLVALVTIWLGPSNRSVRTAKAARAPRTAGR